MLGAKLCAKGNTYDDPVITIVINWGEKLLGQMLYGGFILRVTELKEICNYCKSSYLYLL